MISASALTPLLLMWILSGSSSSARAAQPAAAPKRKPKKSKPPSWPTTSSPPPMPAFVPNPPAPPAPPTAETATPLATLHQQSQPAPARPKPKPKSSAAQQALQAAQSGRIPGVKLPGGLRLPGFAIPGFSASTTPMKVASVRELQGMVNTWGGTLTLDGKYGPKTAAAWSALAKKNNLPATITRNGPTTAKVAVQTYDALNVPNIP